jgi:hypothetical protein
MILPTKHLGVERSLLGIGAIIYELLKEPKTVSRLWSELRDAREKRSEKSTVTYDWFVLGLDFTFLMGLVKYEKGKLWRVAI